MVIKRIIAYFIDILLVTFAASMLASISYINPQLENYNKIYEKINENTDINQLSEINYDLERNNVYGSIIFIGVSLAYFVFFQKYNSNQTLGKKIMKIKISDKLSLAKYFIRALVLYNIFINILKVIFILSLSKEHYILVSKGLYIVALLIETTTIIMVTMRTDNRGLHDLIVGSKVIEEKKEVDKCITA